MQRGRFSFYVGQWVFWLRVRDRQGMPRGFFFRIGKEITILCVVVLLLMGCAGVDKQDARTTAKSKTGDATSITEMEKMLEGAVKADTARDIRTFGLDPGTRDFLTSSFAKGVKFAGVVLCVFLGLVLFFANSKEVSNNPTHRWVCRMIGVSVAVIPAVALAFL